MLLPPYSSALARRVTWQETFTATGRAAPRGGYVALSPAIIIAVIVYAIAIIVFKGIVREDIESLPAGEKIAKVLEKYELLG